MLKGISPLISPELIKLLMEMGHADEIVIADGNFPAASHAQRLVRCDGHGVPELLAAILPLFPLDSYVERPVSLMAVMPGDNVETPIWDRYRDIVRDHHPGATCLRRSSGLLFMNGQKRLRYRSHRGNRAVCQPYFKKGRGRLNPLDVSRYRIQTVHGSFDVTECLLKLK